MAGGGGDRRYPLLEFHAHEVPFYGVEIIPIFVGYEVVRIRYR